MSFTIELAVRFQDVDAGGVLFFARIYDYCHQAYEEFWGSEGIDRAHFFAGAEYLVPIAHSEADYRLPIRHGDRIHVRLDVARVGRASFTLRYRVTGPEGDLRVEVSTVRAPAAATTPYRPAGTPESAASFTAYAIVRVSDTGPGIPAESLDRLFYPFFTTKKHGSGVGLSIAKKIVDSHRGLVDVQSTVGSGSTVTVRLPIVASGSVERPV